MLAWALDRVAMPDYDIEVEPRVTADAIGFLRGRGETVIASPRQRPFHEIVAFAEDIFAVHWRLVEHRLNPRPIDFASFAETASFGPLSLDRARLVDGDLAIGGAAISKADAPLVGKCEGIVSERHRATNWLLGWDEIYSEVDTST